MAHSPQLVGPQGEEKAEKKSGRKKKRRKEGAFCHSSAIRRGIGEGGVLPPP